MLQIKWWKDGFYILEDERVRQFLIPGEKEALLIDTGFADSHVLEAARQVTDLPLKVVLTHGDPDHAGGLADFASCCLHEKDWPLLDGRVKTEPLREGDVLPYGAYKWEVMEIPGHTYGSVALIDWEKKLLLPGDTVQKEGPIYMFGPHRNLDLYIESLERLLKIRDRIETILPCHHACPITPDWIEKNLLDARALRNGELTGEPHPFMPCRTYSGRWTTFYGE